MKIAFVGCGAAGRPLGVAWRRAGHEIGAVHTRRHTSAAVHVLGAGTPDGDLRESDVVVFATPDDALEAAARNHPLRAEQTALHLSGAHPSGILAPTGARCASLHPLCAFADLETALRGLPGTFFFVEGEHPEAVAVAGRLATDLGGKVARISTKGKTLYHAAAAIASNYTVTLLAIARDLFIEAGVEEQQALEALLGLVRGSLDNVERVGIPAGLTGPAARGDADLVARHLRVLPHQLQQIYLALLRQTIPIAVAKGGLCEERAARLRRLVEEGE